MTFKTTQRCCYIGYIVQALIINFAPLLFVIFQNHYNIGYAKIGALVFITFLTQMAVDAFSMFFLDKIGYRRSVVMSHICAAAGFVMMAILPEIMHPYTALCLSVVTYSIGAGLIEVVINPIVEGLPEKYRANLVLTHSFYCWGQLSVVLLTTLALKIFGVNSWNVIALSWALLPLINGFVFIKTPIAPLPPKEKRERVSSLFKSKTFLALLLMMICAGGSELAMSQWASTFAQNALGIDKTIGDLMGPCLFAFFMGIGRTIYGLFESKINYKLYSISCCVLCTVCYIAAALSHNAFISLAGCALCGFAISTLWPATVELAARRFPDGSGAMYGAVAIFGDIGCSVAPFITGIVAAMPLWGENGLRAGLLINIIYPIGFILLVNELVKKR